MKIQCGKNSVNRKFSAWKIHTHENLVNRKFSASADISKSQKYVFSDTEGTGLTGENIADFLKKTKMLTGKNVESKNVDRKK